MREVLHRFAQDAGEIGLVFLIFYGKALLIFFSLIGAWLLLLWLFHQLGKCWRKLT